MTINMSAQRIRHGCVVALVAMLALLTVGNEVRAQEAAPAEAASAVGPGVGAIQEQEPGEHESDEEELKRHKIIFMYGTTWVPQGDPSGDRAGVMVVPTLGVDYE